MDSEHKETDSVPAQSAGGMTTSRAVELVSRPAPTLPAPTATGPVDASTVLGNAEAESGQCIQECLASFGSCTSELDLGTVKSVQTMT